MWELVAGRSERRSTLHFRGVVVLFASLAVWAAAPELPEATVRDSKVSLGAKTPAYCAGTYASDFLALSKKSVEFAQRPDNQFTYCVRVTATYECLSYAADGSLRRAKKTATSHGTAFAYRRDKGDTLLATNHHVIEYPPVTDDEHQVEGVPAGCKRIADTVKIVENERDEFDTDDVALSKVVTDPGLDVAVVRAKATALNVMPWRFGKSAALRERNVVDVRGFPLGAFKAINTGTVISTFDRDDYKDWEHDDFVVDARLSTGNSGSPVLAVSCATGEYELVGIFHAGYTRGSSLNVVVHIDQARELLTTLKRSSMPRVDAPNAPLDGAQRRALVEAAGPAGIFFPYGSLTASVRAKPEGALIFNVYPKGFPMESWPAVVLEDLSPPDVEAFGDLGRVWYGNARGLKEQHRPDINAEMRGQLEKAIDGLRRAAVLSVAYRRAAIRADDSRDAFDRSKRLEKSLKRAASSGKDAVSVLAELSERESLKPGELPDLPAPVPAPPIDAGP